VLAEKKRPILILTTRSCDSSR